LDKALADYGETIRIDPNFAAAFVGRGNAWRAKGELDKALADYGAAIRIDPKLALAYHNRGLTWSDKGELDKALADYGEAIRFDPAFALAYFNRAAAELIASRKGAASDARTYLGLRGWRDDHSLYAVLIGHFGYRQMHRDAEARQILDEAASKGDTSAWPYPVIRYLRREIDEKALLDAAGDNDKMTVARAYLGLDLSLSGRPEEALPHLRWVKEHGNRDYIQYALALAEIDRIEGRKAVSTRP
jgi:tetratricopeptide (TPR) repeat protein